MTSWPRWPSSRAPAGVSATRYSSVLISLATPIFKAASPYLVASVEIQKEAGERLGVLDLAQLRGDLLHGPTDDLELLVTFRTGLAALELLGKEEVHPLAAEARCRVKRRRLAPGPTRQARLFCELAPRAGQRRLALLERARRQLEELAANRLAPLANESQHAVAVDRDNRDGAGVLHDLAVVFAPAFERDVDQLSVVDGFRGIRLHEARRSTRPAATRPAAKAAAKKSESSFGPRPMCASGRPAHASSHPLTSTSRRDSSHCGTSYPAGQGAITSPRHSSSTAHVW